jgi:proline iminopeptidase
MPALSLVAFGLLLLLAVVTLTLRRRGQNDYRKAAFYKVFYAPSGFELVISGRRLLGRWITRKFSELVAAAYAITHPKRVTEMVLRGIFLVSQRELEWFYQEGTSELFPDAWEEYLKPIPLEDRGDMIQAYYKRLTSQDRSTRLAACRAWSIWEGFTSSLYTKIDDVKASFGEETFAEAYARIECHYFVNKAFFKSDSWILDNCSSIAHIPSVIVHGRYDVICPLSTAWQLHKALSSQEDRGPSKSRSNSWHWRRSVVRT